MTILSSISDRLLRALGRRRGVVLLVALVLAGLMGLAASRLDMGQDVTELLPSLAEQDREALDVLSASAFMDRLYVELQGPDPEALARTGNALADGLEQDERIVAVESRVTAEQERRAAAVVFEHRLHLLRPDASVVAERLTREGVRRQLEIGRARLLGPMAGLSVQVARDPLGLAEIVRDDLAGAMGSERLRMYRGLAFTPDLTRCLLVLRTRVRSLAVDDAGLLVDDVRSMAQRAASGGITARVTGPHVFSSESARAVRHDVLRAFGLAVAGIVILFLLYFRRPGFLLAGLLPSSAGVLAGFAISSVLLDRISGIAVGFGSIIVGISVDYSIHYLRERLAEDDPAAALRRILPSLLAGFATTAVVFAFYGISSFPLIRELGLFAGSGVLFGFLTAVLILPLLPARRGEVRTSVRMPTRVLHPTRRASLVALACCAAAVAALGAFLPRLDLEDDIRKLDYRDPGTARFAEEFEERWLGEQEGRVIIARGTTVQEALEVNDVVGLAGSRGGVPMTSLAPVLPSIATQRRNVEEISRRVAGLRETIEAEADDLGFSEGMFDPFFDDLDATLDGTTGPLTVHDLEGTPMGHLAASSIVRQRNGAAVLTFVPGAVPMSFSSGLDAMVTSRVEIMNRVFESVRSEVLRLVVLSLLGIALVLLLTYRRIRPALVAMVPVVVACVITAGVFALAGKPVNAIAALAFTLILGVGLDYGIFMVDALERGPGSDHTAGAVLVSGLTTLVSFGVLWTCRNPVLESTGLVVLTGVLASLVGALVVVPAIHSLATGGRQG